MQHPVDDDRAVLHLEVKPVVLRPEAIQQPPVAINFPKPISVQVIQIFLPDLELFEQFKLFERPQLRELGSADFVKNNLKHPVSLATARAMTSAKTAASPAAHLPSRSILSAKQLARFPEQRGKAYNLPCSHLRPSKNSPFFARTRDFSLSMIFKSLNTLFTFGLAKKTIKPLVSLQSILNGSRQDISELL